MQQIVNSDCMNCGAVFMVTPRRKKFCGRTCSATFKNSNGINNGSVKRCPRCLLVRPVSEFYKNKARIDGLSVLCWECHTKEDKLLIEELKGKIFEKLGHCCKRCGFSADTRALQIDHVNGDGKYGRVNQRSLYMKVLSDTSGMFQILCANCNTVKRIENHESKMSSKPRRKELAA